MAITNYKIEQNEKFSFVKKNEQMQMKIIPAAICAILSLVLIILPVHFSLKFIFPVILVFLVIPIFSVSKEGVYVETSGKIKIVSGFGSETFEFSELKRIAMNFKEWENGEFTAQIKFVFNEGDVFLKDYGARFENTSNHMFLSSYTIPKSEMEALCAKFAEMNICNISVIDINQDIVYQYIRK